jgi:D-beta-D-heptose 7-phosphate kinase/D-beta-D-heptose 1-phosphate adenosyltransferase
MTVDLLALLDAVAGRRVLVIGEAMLDAYFEGSAGRVCREAPLPVIAVSERRDLPGGAANTAVNVHNLGGRVTFLSATGADDEASRLRQALEERGVATDCVFARSGRRTLVKNRVVAEGQILFRFDEGSTDPVDRNAEQALIDRLGAVYAECAAVLVSDYGYGIVTPRVLRALTELQALHPRVLVVDSKRRLRAFRNVGVTAVKPNYEEAVELLGPRGFEGNRPRAEAVSAQADRLLEITGSRIAAVTLDAEGTIVLERGRPAYRTFSRPARQSCVAGAGDTFVSALALALAAGAPTAVATELASAAAAVVVAKERTAVCSAADLREVLAAQKKYFPDARCLAERVAFYRQQGRRVVFTNGCFDILHRGHITYLHRAKALGDVLIVGLNTDDGIRRLKGPTRPINPLEDRVQVLAALGCVDHVVPFAEDTPCELIRLLRPEVFVKGGDYVRERLPEAPLVEALGGVVHILPFLADRSTTRIIERIQETQQAPVVCAVPTGVA